jgi:hypothetical protein
MRRSANGWLLLLVLAMSCMAKDSSDYRAGSLAKQEVQAIYAADSGDSWNRIFYFLFTRTVELRLTNDFKEGGPFSPIAVMGNDSLPVTTRTFQRIEAGDRAVDPLYPSFLTAKGAEFVLVDPQFSALKAAVLEACAETAARPPLHRALMQSDVWAAYDILRRVQGNRGQFGSRVRELLPLLGRFISQLALSSQEIASLPRNYQSAQQHSELPNFFEKRAGWMEVEWLFIREHDRSVDDRRAVRVFLKPPGAPEEFLANANARVKRNQDPLPDQSNSLEGAALVTEGLLIDRSGHAVASPLTYEVQLRTFVKNAQGRTKSTTIVQYELSRKALLTNSVPGGLIRVGADEPAYLPSAGNDYSFASPPLLQNGVGAPVLGFLRRRCESCHGPDATSILTFQMHAGPNAAPTVRLLRPGVNEHADQVAQEKMKRADFKSLQWSH